MCVFSFASFLFSYRSGLLFLVFLAPSVEVVRSQMIVEENVGQVKIPLRRTGDSSQRLYVTCLTTSDMEEGMKYIKFTW